MKKNQDMEMRTWTGQPSADPKLLERASGPCNHCAWQDFYFHVQCLGGPLDVDWSFLMTAPSKWRGMVDIKKLFTALSFWGMETSCGAIKERNTKVRCGPLVLLISVTTA